jgi:short-subunit dehydrogenase
VQRRFNSVHLLVNNAGVFRPGSIAEEPDGVFELQMNTNVASAYHLTRALLQELKKSDKALIVNMCSTASITAYVNGGSYCISKFALLGMSKVLREELKNTQVAVTSLLPGATLTNSWAGTELPASRFMQPSDVAEVVFQAWNLSPSAVLEEVLLRPIAGDFD